MACNSLYGVQHLDASPPPSVTGRHGSTTNAADAASDQHWDEDAPLLGPSSPQHLHSSAVELVPTANTPPAPHAHEFSFPSSTAGASVAPHSRGQECVAAVVWWRPSDVARLWRQQRPLYRGVWAHIQALAWSMLLLYATTLAMFPGVQLQVSKHHATGSCIV